MDALEFERRYAQRSGVTVERLRALGQVVLPCRCDEDGCEGWQVLSRRMAADSLVREQAGLAPLTDAEREVEVAEADRLDLERRAMASSSVAEQRTLNPQVPGSSPGRPAARMEAVRGPPSPIETVSFITIVEVDGRGPVVRLARLVFRPLRAATRMIDRMIVHVLPAAGGAVLLVSAPGRPTEAWALSDR